MKFISQKLSADLLAGVITTLLGAFALWGSSLIEREEGVLGGPHVVPQAASIFLLCMGLGIVALALASQREKKVKGLPQTRSSPWYPWGAFFMSWRYTQLAISQRLLYSHR